MVCCYDCVLFFFFRLHFALFPPRYSNRPLPTPSPQFLNSSINVQLFNSSLPPDPLLTIASSDETQKDGNMSDLTTVLLFVAPPLVVVLISIAIMMRWNWMQKKAAQNDISKPSENSLEVEIIDLRTHTMEELSSLEEGTEICTYTKEELAKATDNFRNKVGQGASGFVYRANLPGNRIGAVKRATDLDPKLFKLELSVLLRLPRHPHLVDLIGLCLQEGERMLVFEFISNGSLYDRLHTARGLASPLSWSARMDIAWQVAVALQYLHEEAKPQILHRDVKSANVLLVDDNTAKLADFGLSKLGQKENQFTITAARGTYDYMDPKYNHQFTVTAVRGTYGYIDPQYVRTSRYSTKSDVYSFGVLLLELITGFKSVHEDTPLAEWTQTYRFSEGIDRFMTIVDQNLIDEIDMMELQIMIKIANLCLGDSSEERSSMREIMTMMQDNIKINANRNLSDGDEALHLANEILFDCGATVL